MTWKQNIEIMQSDSFFASRSNIESIKASANEQNVDFAIFENAARVDPLIAAKLLLAASSQSNQKVDSIQNAINALGQDGVVSLLVYIAHQQTDTAPYSLLFQNDCAWCHSVAVAVTARLLGGLFLDDKLDELYTAGLLHDIGFLVLDRINPKGLDRAIAMCNDKHLSIEDAEHYVMGYDHTETGEYLAKCWGLSETLQQVIRYHHIPIFDANNVSICSIVHIADIITQNMGFSIANIQAVKSEWKDIIKSLELDDCQLEFIRQHITKEMNALKKGHHSSSFSHDVLSM